jgi:hypothetical protein
MTESILEESMRIGADADYSNNDLGKFGMGMKTASLSHCDKLTVISKTEGDTITGYRWDMARIKSDQKKWILLKLEEPDIIEISARRGFSTDFEKGTIVIWEDMIPLSNDAKSYTSQKLTNNFFFRVVSDLKLHLGMVFHRFLDGSLNSSNINIVINDNVLEPWDPFCRSEPETAEVNLPQNLETLSIPNFDKPVLIKGYVLPTKSSFSSEEAWKNAKGLVSWNDSQGYYIYRSNRIIRFGGWHGTKAKDEHDKLARISIDIDQALDSLFRITVNKNKVQFPEILYYHLKTKVNSRIIKGAKARYRKTEEAKQVNNRFRKNNSKLQSLSKSLIAEHKISTSNNHSKSKNDVVVSNPSGTWLSNKINDFLKHGSNEDFEIVSEPLNDDQLWKIICNEGDKFKVILNSSHLFYKSVYENSSNRKLTGPIDAIIFSLAFSELYNKNEVNRHLFETFKTVCSQALEKISEQEIL